MAEILQDFLQFLDDSWNGMGYGTKEKVKAASALIAGSSIASELAYQFAIHKNEAIGNFITKVLDGTSLPNSIDAALTGPVALGLLYLYLDQEGRDGHCIDGREIDYGQHVNTSTTPVPLPVIILSKEDK